MNWFSFPTIENFETPPTEPSKPSLLQLATLKNYERDTQYQTLTRILPTLLLTKDFSLLQQFLQLHDVTTQTKNSKTSNESRSVSLKNTILGEKKIKKSERVKGQIYVVKGVRKKWDGRRFARCCLVPSCSKLSQGATMYCKAHGGGRRCSQTGCDVAARGGKKHCSTHVRNEN